MYRIGFIDKEYLLSVLITGIEMNPLKSDVLCSQNKNSDGGTGKFCSERNKKTADVRTRRKGKRDILSHLEEAEQPHRDSNLPHTAEECDEWSLPAHTPW